MFENPTDYNDANAFTILSTKEVFKEYLKYIKIKEKDLILDVGCGSGNVTTEVLIPALQLTDFRLVGVDYIQTVVDFANKNFGNSKVSFRFVDMIGKDEKVLKAAFTKKELNPGFDLVFSFSVVQWTFNVEQCLRNKFALLKPGGQTLFWFIGYSMLTDIWQAVLDKEQWRSYIKGPAARFEFHDSTDVVGEVTNLLKTIGFEVIVCKCVSKDFIHDVNYSWRKIMQCIDPHIRNVPEHLHSQYMDDIMVELTRLYKKNNCVAHDRIIVVASKPIV